MSEVLPKQIISTGISRSGTFSLHKFFEEMGVNSYHQRHYRHETHKHFFNYSRGERWVVQYNLDNPLNMVTKAVNEMQLPIDLPSNCHFFISTWAVSEVMYLIQQKFPQIEWIVVMRNVKDVSNSLRRYVWKKNKMDKVDVDYFALLYINIYHFILKQVYKMSPKPYFLDFEDMVNNRKSKELLELFGLTYNEERKKQSEEFWKVKHNTMGSYSIDEPYIGYTVFANELRDSLKEVCRCL